MKENKEKPIKIKCSFCGKEIECPPGMLNSEKHACFECFEKLMENPPKDEDLSKVHVDIPMEKMDEFMPKMLISSLMKDAFPAAWKEIEPQLKGKTAREVAERMFAEGILAAFDAILTIGQEAERTRQKVTK